MEQINKMVTKFTYNDIVYLVNGVPADRLNQRCWVVGVVEDRTVFPLVHMPAGVIYAVEFEDGSAADVAEAWLSATSEHL